MKEAARQLADSLFIILVDSDQLFFPERKIESDCNHPGRFLISLSIGI